MQQPRKAIKVNFLSFFFGVLEVFSYICTDIQNKDEYDSNITTHYFKHWPTPYFGDDEQMQNRRVFEATKKLLFDFYSKEAVAEADRSWEAGVIDESKIEEWGQEHMRTPYIHAK